MFIKKELSGTLIKKVLGSFMKTWDLIVDIKF